MIVLELWGLFVSAFISSTIAPGGSEALLAYLVAEKVQSVMLLVIVATIGNTLGALTTWWLGSLTAKKIPAEQLLDNNKQNALRWVKQWGYWSLLFSWLPIVGDGLCFAGGWLKLPLFISTILIAIGKLLRYLFVAYWFV
ncbi:MAG: DedA family protein [Gammaproteobacteria bacterium]|nr:DedA family protein [Gammaproteobacteria bacterium]MBT4145985.1 DedA family protein [Gammaproteobacteria bacterium]MBT5222373.1 DedA family protein [Gammaproteobacteria bacterium]MBT5965890.1 DedA family protein [Gammaproteobacteria bacterium]MBT6576714.1 DedA family protein [Gammaproteobacteria bacterium]